MDTANKVHTSFIIAFGTYCYKIMSFSLKNAGATFQQMVIEVFKPQIGRNMELYVDDMIVKSKECDAKFIYTKMGMNLKTNQRDYYYNALDILYPGLKEDYIAVYGNKNFCNSLHYRHLMELYLKKCSEDKILTDMDMIIEDYKKEIPQNELNDSKMVAA